jgi:starch-binding outer membrane protein, SusD/RagB family
MMKSRIILALTMLITTIFTGCNSQLDDQVNAVPFDQAPIEELFRTQQNVQGLLYSSYNKLQDYSQFIRADALYSDDFDLTSQFQNNDRKQFLIPDFGIFNGEGRTLWATGYAGIGFANTVVFAVDNRTFVADQATYNRLKGEALFIRAFYHFVLCNYYALPYTADPNKPGIIIRTEYLTLDQAQKPFPRNTIAETYAQINKDLNDAISLLPNDNSVFASGLACKALLARVNFYAGQNDKAFAFSDDLIKSGGFTFSDSLDLSKDTNALTRPFNISGNSFSKNKGYIFQIINQSNDDGSGPITGEFYNPQGFASVGFPIQQGSGSLYSLLTSEGQSLRVRKLIATGAGKVVQAKFKLGPVNIPILRLAEQYLIRAESNVLKGGYIESDVLSDLNTVRALNGETLITTGNTQDGLLQLIRKERRMELFGEGIRWMETRRLNIGITKQYGTNPNFVSLPTDSKGLLKIPDSETAANANLVQN